MLASLMILTNYELCGTDHARGTFKKSSYATLGKSQEQPITVDGEPNNASIPMESSIPNVNEESSSIPAESENKQKGKMVDGSSSTGKKRKDDVTFEELNAIVMGIPGQFTREEKDKAFMFLAKNEHYANFFLAKPKNKGTLQWQATTLRTSIASIRFQASKESNIRAFIFSDYSCYYRSLSV